MKNTPQKSSGKARGAVTKANARDARNPQTSRGVDARATRGNYAKNKDKLGSDRDRTMSTKPAARQDQFGSEHNRDDRIKAQQKKGRPKKGGENPSFRESAQDLQPNRGSQNKKDFQAKNKASRRRPG